MARICILSAVNIKHMSLISLYTTILEKRNIPYDIVYMDKYGEEEHISAEHIYRYVNIIDSSKPKLIKAMQYARFIGYAKRILERNKYDFIIVWNDVAIVMFGLYLARRWKGRYCLNIRDYCGEKRWLIYRIFKRAIDGAAFTTISSEGFKAFLPKARYVPLHSFNENLLKGIVHERSLLTESRPLRISFIGNVRFFEENKRLIDTFKGSPDYILAFHGTNAHVLEQYAEETGAANVEFSGSFPISETGRFLQEADLINNVFGNGTTGVQTLTSIRLFYAAYLRIPILVSSNTHMARVVEKYGIGYVVDGYSDDLPEKLGIWYSGLDREKFVDGCETLLQEARETNDAFRKMMDKYIRA